MAFCPGYTMMRGAGTVGRDEWVLEEGPESAGSLEVGAPLQQSWCRKRHTMAAVFGSIACALSVGAWTWMWRSEAPQASLVTPRSRFEQLWWKDDVYGPCPDPGPKTGGVPRTPLFHTLAQAWACLDQDADGKLGVEELPPGGKLMDVTYSMFHDLILKARQSANRAWGSSAEPSEAARVREWVELSMKWMPASEGKMRANGQPPSSAEPEPTEALPSALDGSQVSELYTFGAPAPVKGGQLTNPGRPDGCFPGLRTYMQGSFRIPDLEVRLEVADPTTWLLSGVGFEHPKQAVLSLNEDNVFQSGYSECGDHWNGPKVDLLFWFSGHSQRLYQKHIDELAGLLHARSDHDHVMEDHLAATDVQTLPGSRSPLCSKHPKCASLFPDVGESVCCPDAAGTLRDCCSESVAEEDRFVVTSPFVAGDVVRVTSNETLLRQALLQVVYTWNDGMKNMLGQAFPVTRVPSPGVVGLPSTDGTNGGLWYFPVTTLTLVPPEESPRSQRRLEAASLDDQRRTNVAKARAMQHLAAATYQESDSIQDRAAEDLRFAMISHVLVSRNATGVTPIASLFQDPSTQECVVAFGFSPAVGYKHQIDYSDEENSAFTQAPRVSESIYTWWAIYAGLEPIQYHGEAVMWARGRDNGIFERPLSRTIDANGICTMATPYGHRPCPDNATLDSLNYQGWSKATTSREWCGIKDVEIYFADALAYFTQQQAYTTGIFDNLPSCSKVTATGHDMGGAFAALWSACVNSNLQPGQSGYEDYVRVAWAPTDAEGVRLVPFFAPHGLDADTYSLKNKRSGQILVMTGEASEVHLGRGGLALEKTKEAGSKDRWQLTPEGFLRNTQTKKCIGVAGDLGSSRPEANVGLSAEAQVCQYGLKNTAQSWNFTSRGMLANQYTALCLSTSMTLSVCPMTDQAWHLRTDGYIVNQLSGHCLDVDGNPGIDEGDKVVLWPCEYNNEDTDQRWEYTKEGFLKNMRSGRCLDVKHINSVSTGEAQTVLWDCVETLAAPIAQVWILGDQGSLQNRMTGKCLDVLGRHSTAPGTEVVLASCHTYVGDRSENLWELSQKGEIINRGTTSSISGLCIGQSDSADSLELKHCDQHFRQHWYVTQDGHVNPAEHVHMCLGTHASSLGIFEECLGSNATWYISEEGFLINRGTSLCIDVSSDGVVREDYCHMTDQKWYLMGDGHLMHKLSGRCLDVVGGPPLSLNAGSALQLWDCSSEAVGTDQAWDSNGTHLKNILSGLCVDVESTQDGALLVMATCDDTRKEQEWATKAGFLKNVASGKCADIVGIAGHADGEQLKLWNCETGVRWTDQTWDLELTSKHRTFDPMAALRPPLDFRPAFWNSGTTGLGEQVREQGVPQMAGEFVSSGKEVYWLYRGFKHLVPTSDCSECNCKSRIVVVEQTSIDAFLTGENYDCKLQSLANVFDGFATKGPAAVTSEWFATLSGAGRFVTTGRNVYWEYNGRRHEVAPGAGCNQCGCENQVLISEEEMASIPIGQNFQCEMSGIAQYGAHFMK